MAIAPCSPFDVTLGWRGLGWLAQRYRVEFTRDMFAKHGYLAGDRDRRSAELIRAIADPQIRAVVAMRGGYGLNHIAHLPDWELFACKPKWIVGFSDITALHVEAARVGVMSLHAPMVASLGRGHAPSRDLWQRVLESPCSPIAWQGLRPLRAGQASGPLYGGNLSVLHACAAAGRLIVPNGAILFLEDIGERPYRIDRMLTTLTLGGYFAHLAGVVLGQFTKCDAGADGVSVQRVLEEILCVLGVPVADGLPCGHEIRNDPLVLGAHAYLHVGCQEASLVVQP